MSSAVDIRINEVARDFLMGNLPVGLPAELVIRAAQDQALVARPLAVTRCEDGETPHRKMRRVTFVLELTTHADDAATLADLEVHQALVNVLAENTAELSAALLAVGLKLRKFVPGAFSDDSDDGEGKRGRMYAQRWLTWVELI